RPLGRLAPDDADPGDRLAAQRRTSRWRERDRSSDRHYERETEALLRSDGHRHDDQIGRERVKREARHRVDERHLERIDALAAARTLWAGKLKDLAGRSPFRDPAGQTRTADVQLYRAFATLERAGCKRCLRQLAETGELTRKRRLELVTTC